MQLFHKQLMGKLSSDFDVCNSKKAKELLSDFK